MLPPRWWFSMSLPGVLITCALWPIVRASVGAAVTPLTALESDCEWGVEEGGLALVQTAARRESAAATKEKLEAQGPIVTYGRNESDGMRKLITGQRQDTESARDHEPDSTSTTSSAAGMLFIVFGCLSMLSAGIVFCGSLSSASASAPAAAAALDDSKFGLTSPGKKDEGKGKEDKGDASRRPVRRRTTGGETANDLSKRWTIYDEVDQMSSFSFIVNMFADLCPPGFLPLAFGLKDTGYVPAFIILGGFCCLCIYTMFTIGKASEITGEIDFCGQWTRAIGAGSAWVPVLVVVLICFGCNLSYSCFFADILTGVMPAFGFPMPRWMNLLLFTMFPLLPLCLLKNLAALSYSSTFALFAVLYTAGMMVLRATDGSYVEGGTYFAGLPPSLAPQVPSEHLFEFGLPSLVLVNTLAMAFVSHYNGCKYYRELELKSPQKLLRCTATAMTISACLFVVTMVAGFQTFGTAADGVILKNYSQVDPLANIGRLGVGLSIICSFPLMFSGLREAVITLIKQVSPAVGGELDIVWKQDLFSIALLMLITSVALVITDAGLVVSLVGSICGSAIIYVVPCTLYAAVLSGSGLVSGDNRAYEVIWLRCLIALGFILGILGCASSLMFV